jgi:phenylalanyl-tRNA synthetase beta subunit
MIRLDVGNRPQRFIADIMVCPVRCTSNLAIGVLGPLKPALNKSGKVRAETYALVDAAARTIKNPAQMATRAPRATYPVPVRDVAIHIREDVANIV